MEVSHLRHLRGCTCQIELGNSCGDSDRSPIASVTLVAATNGAAQRRRQLSIRPEGRGAARAATGTIASITAPNAIAGTSAPKARSRRRVAEEFVRCEAAPQRAQTPLQPLDRQRARGIADAASRMSDTDPAKSAAAARAARRRQQRSGQMRQPPIAGMPRWRRAGCDQRWRGSDVDRQSSRQPGRFRRRPESRRRRPSPRHALAAADARSASPRSVPPLFLVIVGALRAVAPDWRAPSSGSAAHGSTGKTSAAISVRPGTASMSAQQFDRRRWRRKPRRRRPVPRASGTRRSFRTRSCSCFARLSKEAAA